MEIIIDDWYRYPVNADKYEEINIDYYVVKNDSEFNMAIEKLINNQFFIVQHKTSKKIYVRALSYVSNGENYAFLQFENNIWVRILH